VITEADSLAAVGEAPYDYLGVTASAGGAPLTANLAIAGAWAKHSGCTLWISRTRLDS
jgi:hypothetical protein